MLALTRKIDERIQIGRDIFITILHVRGKQVRVGIEAPKHVRVKRAELDDETDGEMLSLAELLERASAAASRAKQAGKRRPIRRQPGTVNPGERAFGGCQPLAEKLQARRAMRVPAAVA